MKPIALVLEEKESGIEQDVVGAHEKNVEFLAARKANML
jgi:hypothetical protein